MNAAVPSNKEMLNSNKFQILLLVRFIRESGASQSRKRRVKRIKINQETLSYEETMTT
jgi:hypothetical protein